MLDVAQGAGVVLELALVTAFRNAGGARITVSTLSTVRVTVSMPAFGLRMIQVRSDGWPVSVMVNPLECVVAGGGA